MIIDPISGVVKSYFRANDETSLKETSMFAHENLGYHVCVSSINRKEHSF